MNFKVDPILVHVGFHKTGTTWLQYKVFNQANSGFWPLSKQGDDCREFGWEFLYGTGTGRNRQGHLDSPFDFDIDFLKSKLDHLRSNAKGYPVVSHEDLSGHIWSGGFTKRELADRIHAVVPQAKILITVREQISLILSAYYHYLWNGGMCSLAAYIETYNEFQVPLFNPRHLFYDEFVAYYQKLFSKKNVLVLTYEDFCLSPKSYIEDLYTFVGLEKETSSLFQFKKRINTRSEKINCAQQLTRFLNIFGSRNNLNGRLAIGSTHRRQQIVKSFANKLPASMARRMRNKNKLFLKKQLEGVYDDSNLRLAGMLRRDIKSLGYAMATDNNK